MASIENVTVKNFKDLFARDFPFLPSEPVENPLDYVRDEDIERAFLEAKINFNPNFFTDDDTAIMVYLYLAAHYLVIDLNNANNSLSLGFKGLVQSKSVGSVSESYALPSFVTNNPVLSQFMQTGYGQKYVSLIYPYLVGNIMLIRGATTCE